MNKKNVRDEINSQDNILESQGVNETQNVLESHEVKASQDVNESASYSESGPLGGESQKGNEKKKEEESSKVNKIAHGVSLASVAIGAVVLVVAVVPGILTSSKISADFSSYLIKENSISFALSFSNPNNESYRLNLHNDFVDKEVEASLNDEGNILSGVASSLNPGVSYSLNLYSGSKKVTSLDFSTPRIASSSLTNISYKCTCYLDGMFHFSLDVDDPNHHWSNYYATLTDTKGVYGASDIFFQEETSLDHTIDVDSNGLSGETASFKVFCYSDIVTEEHPDALTNPYEFILFVNEEVKI